jgi:hypothetical protein
MPTDPLDCPFDDNRAKPTDSPRNGRDNSVRRFLRFDSPQRQPRPPIFLRQDRNDPGDDQQR